MSHSASLVLNYSW